MGRWPGSCREIIRRRHVHIMLELARDMRQIRTFAPRMAMYKYTVQAIIQ
jgi:hypothetical protein